MFNFSSMFATFRGGQGSSLSELLAMPNVSLMRLLDEQSFISEFRSGSSAIKDYMTYGKFQQLVELVTLVGDPFDKKRSFKFPLTAADLLASETPFVLEKLLPQEGSVVEEERVVTSEEKEVEQEVEDDDDEEEEEGTTDKKQQGEAKPDGQQEQEFGEFVSSAAVVKKKIIKVKEVVETVTAVKKSYPPLIDSILAYFGSEMNYTLTSYCCRVLTSLLNKRSNRFLAKFFQDETYPTNVLKHIGSRSVVQLVTRIFTIQNTDQLDKRIQFFRALLTQASVSHELQVLSNISAALCQTFEKLATHLKTNAPCRELQGYFSIIPELLSSTVSNIVGEHEGVSVYSAPFIFQLLNCLPAELDGSAVDEALGRFLQGAVGKLQGAVADKKSRLGVGRVKMIEVLNFIIKRQNIRQLLSQRKGFFPILFSVIKTYPLNNILHNEAFKLISASLNSETASLAQSLLEGDALIQWLQEQADEEGKRGQSSPAGRSPRGYAGHLVNLCKLIRENTSTAIISLKQDTCFQQVAKILVDKVVISHQRNLGGYSMRKNLKFPIMFSKEDILKQHAAFLSNARPPVFENDPDNPLLNAALMQELQRQLDGVDLSPPKPEQVVQEERHKAELIEENEQHKSAFWKVHLDYEVDDLMFELQ